ncbi:MAG TPA: helix-turn-helix transcriptional regulator [Nevskiales bacterium]|nr:helix-turn-helix transcriptional regulator [Nevskiales bacterium]
MAKKIIIRSKGNVFEDLGFDPAEAAVMEMRARLMAELRLRIKGKGWTQKQAAERLGITQPRVSALIKGKYEQFSLDMLLQLALKAGLHPEVRLAA